MVSVIIPVYNSEQFLDRCLKSIISQTLQDIEFIVINNGSNDGSLDICNKYAALDTRIKVVTKQHGGVASARNLGLDKAKGDYIGFVDSDDNISPDMFEKMLGLLNSHQADIAVCNAEHAKEINSEIEQGITLYEHDDIFFKLLENKMSSHLWNKLFKAELFDGLRIPEDDIAGDLSVMHILFDRAKRVVTTDECLYDYFINSNSVSRNIDNQFRNKYDRAKVFEKRYYYGKENYGYESSELFGRFIEFYARAYAIGVLSEGDTREELKTYLSDIKDKIKKYKKYINKCSTRIENKVLCWLILMNFNFIIRPAARRTVNKSNGKRA